MNERDVTREVRRLVRLLGQNPRQIATSLANKGIVGCRSDADACPLANYLQQELGLDDGFDVDVADDVRLWDYNSDEGMAVALPKYVQQFIDRFDRGRYPDLIAPEDRDDYEDDEDDEDAMV